jgi:hypothetical protein
LASPDGKYLLAGQRVVNDAMRLAAVVSMETGAIEPVRGMDPKEVALGWSSDDQVYVETLIVNNRTAVHIDKLNPHTGARAAWRDLAMPPIGGVFPDPPIITPDGATYGFDYRLRLSDIYTVSGVR